MLTLFTTPYFEPSKIYLPTTSSIVVDHSANNLSNSELGLKLNKVGGEADWSVSYYRGFNLFPSTRVIGNSAMQPALELHYDRISVFGSDFARNFGSYGARGEIAYVNTEDKPGTDPGIINPYLSWVIGVDRTFLENLNINLQFFQRQIQDYHNPEYIVDPAERAVAIQNAITGGQQDPVSNGISFRVASKWLNDTLEAEIFGILNLTRNGHFLRPFISYAFSDQLKGIIGGEFYEGADNTQFGILKRNQGMFVELRYGL